MRTDGFQRQIAISCRSGFDPLSDVTDDGSVFLELVANDPQSIALALGSDDWAMWVERIPFANALIRWGV